MYKSMYFFFFDLFLMFLKSFSFIALSPFFLGGCHCGQCPFCSIEDNVHLFSYFFINSVLLSLFYFNFIFSATVSNLRTAAELDWNRDEGARQRHLLIKYALNMKFIGKCRLQRLYPGRVFGAASPAGILTSKVRGGETHPRPYKANPRAVLSAVYAWKCKTPTVLHFSKLIFNGGVCELYSLGWGPICYPSGYQI